MSERIALAAIATIALCVFVACSGGPSATPTATPATIGGEWDAKMQAEKFVRAALKHPHDAEFPYTGGTAKYNATNGTWTVAGTVKAANSFGAKLTHEWQCSLFVSGGRWSCRALVLDDEILHFDAETPTPLQDPATEPDEPNEPEPADEEDASLAVSSPVELAKPAGRSADRPVSSPMQDASKGLSDDSGDTYEPPTREEHAAIDEAQKNEERAAAKLRLARVFHDNGKESNRDRYLRELVKEFPDTQAASEARAFAAEKGIVLQEDK